MKVNYRSIFIASKGKLLVSIDLSQAESWIVAYLSDERNMKYALMNSDIHCVSGGAIYFLNGCNHDWDKSNRTCIKCNNILSKEQRYTAKRRNHASSYGMSPYKAMEVINSDSDKPPYVSISLSESKEHHKLWHSYYDIKSWWAEVKSKDRQMTTTYGRSRTFYGQWLDSPIDKPSDLEREKIAYEPQSVVADHFSGMIHPIVQKKGGLIEIYRQLIKPYVDHNIVNMSHDSCILELPKECAREVGLRSMRLLERPIVIKDEEFTIPCDGKIGDRWSEGEMEELK